MTGPQGTESGAEWAPQSGQPDPWQAPQAAEAAPQEWSEPAYGQSEQQVPQYQVHMPEYPAAGYGAPQGQPGYPDPAQFSQGGFGPGEAGYPGATPPQFGASQPESNRKVLIGISAGLGTLLLIALLVTGFWWPGFFVTTTLNVDRAQEGVAKVLSDDTNGYGAKNVKDVKCNDGKDPEVKQGATFTCDVSVDGSKRQVTVTFQDDKGTYEVGRPK